MKAALCLVVFVLVCGTFAQNVVQTNVNFHFKGIVNAVQKQQGAATDGSGSVVGDIPGPGEGQNGDFTLLTEPYEYRSDFLGQDYEGYIAWQQRNTLATRPAVIVVPDFLNIEEEQRERARQFAEMGYIAFVCDLYGKGNLFSRDTREQITMAHGLARDLRESEDINHYMAPLSALIRSVRNDSRVDITRVILVGAGFGGRYILDFFRSGNVDTLGGVVFHPESLLPVSNEPSATGVDNILAFLGNLDGNTKDQLQQFNKELIDNRVQDSQVVLGTFLVGCFSDSRADLLSRHAPDIFDARNCAYDRKATARYWATAKAWVNEHFNI